MTALPRRVCPYCGRLVPVRSNGALREHKPDSIIDSDNCEGSGEIVTAPRPEAIIVNGREGLAQL